MPSPILNGEVMSYHHVSIPAPSKAPTVLVPSSQASGTMSPVPLGDFDFAMTFVDWHGRHSAMSPHYTERLLDHWLAVSVPPDLNTFHEAVCYCLWWRVTGSTKWYPMGGQQFVQCPYLPFTGFTNHYLRGHMVWLSASRDSYDSPNWKKGAKLSDGSDMVPMMPPTLRFMHPPKQGLLARWRWLIGGNGIETMTDPSPVCEIPPAAQDERYVIMIGLHDAPKNGCIARLVELNDPATGGWRPPVRYPLHANLINIHDLPDVNAEYRVPYPTGDGALIHAVQKQADTTMDDVVINYDSCTLLSPLVNQYCGSTFGRTIGKTNGGRWKLIARHTGPAFLECNQDTRLVGCHIESSTASAGIDFCDTTPQGGGCYRFRTERLVIDLYNPNSGEYQDAYGIGVMAESGSAERGHTCSEPVFSDTKIVARNPIIVEGKQSANWLFRQLEIWGGYNGMNSAIVLNNANDIRILDKMMVDGVRALISVPNGRAALMEGVYTDQGIPQWSVTGNGGDPYIRVDWTSGQNQIGKIQGVTADTGIPSGFSFTTFESTGTVNNNLQQYYFPPSD